MSEITGLPKPYYAAGAGLPKPYYDDGKGIVIYCGNCREILPLLEPVDLVLTDPPYGNADIMRGGAQGSSNGPFTRITRTKEGVFWDNERPHDLVDLAISKGEDSIVWGGNYYSLPPSRCWIVWNKPDSMPSFADCELAWCSKDRNAKVIHATTASTNAERCGHPTQKPYKVMAFCLAMFPKAETILDPFMGSGTTLVAAKNLGRKCIGIELEEKYCEIAVNRLAQDVLDFSEVQK